VADPELFQYAVYTTLAGTVFTQALAAGALTFKEGKRWTGATHLLDEARAHGQRVPLLVSDGAYDCSKLIGWAVLDRVELSDDGTRVWASELRPLKRHRTQELLLRKSGQPIAEGFIRPYALVHTPGFLPAGSPRSLGSTDAGDPPTIFSFGYEGCGSGTARLVAAVDKVEGDRGFEPPLWIDARVSRSVRAIGFREKAFEHLLGSARYHWMSDLGNERVQQGRAGMQIRRPEAVADLLQLALDTPRRRVIFFCSCSGSSSECHRHEVGRLLLRHARAVGARIRRVEWPGGEPVTLALDVASTAALKRKTIDTRGILGEAEAAAVPWGSHGILSVAKNEAEHVLLGPALFGEKQTVLRVVEHLGPETPGDPLSIARRWRKAHGTDVQAVG
jgi:hypothetical protein